MNTIAMIAMAMAPANTGIRFEGSGCCVACALGEVLGDAEGVIVWVGVAVAVAEGVGVGVGVGVGSVAEAGKMTSTMWSLK